MAIELRPSGGGAYCGDHIRGANTMTMAEQTPARFSIDDLLKGHASLLRSSSSNGSGGSKDEVGLFSSFPF